MSNTHRSDRCINYAEITDILRLKFETLVSKKSTFLMFKSQAFESGDVYYSLLSDLASDNEKAKIGLKKATGAIKSELAKRMTLYKIPDLIFAKDESVAYGGKIDELLRNLNQD